MRRAIYASGCQPIYRIAVLSSSWLLVGRTRPQSTKLPELVSACYFAMSHPSFHRPSAGELRARYDDFGRGSTRTVYSSKRDQRVQNLVHLAQKATFCRPLIGTKLQHFTSLDRPFHPCSGNSDILHTPASGPGRPCLALHPQIVLPGSNSKNDSFRNPVY